MQCPKCGAGVTEDKTSCPICFADLEAVGCASGPTGLQIPNLGHEVPEEELVAGIPGIDNRPKPNEPPPNYMSGGGGMGGGGGEVRVSLTGEVLEVMQPTPRNMPGPGGIPAPGNRPMTGPVPPAGARGSHLRPIREEAGPKSTAGPVALILLLIIVFGGGGYGGWYWYNNRTNPKDQALKVVDAYKNFNWKELFILIAWSSDTKYTADQFANEAEKQVSQAKTMGMGQLVDQAKQLLQGIKTTAGEPKIDGNKAEVPMTHNIQIAGRTQTTQGTARMIRQGGIWKLDLTMVSPSASQQEAYLAGQRVFGEMFGANGGTGGGMLGGMGQ